MMQTVTVGDRLPTFQREGTLHHWNRFAAVNDEFADHHMDDAEAKHQGFDRAFAMAPLENAYIHSMLTQWAGDDARIVSVQLRYRFPLVRGRTLIAGGEVTATRREGDELVVDLDVWADDDEGTRLAPGTATVAIPASTPMVDLAFTLGG